MNVSLIDKLKFSHDGDQSQLDVIFSSESKLIVEAPAGYGKTKTMVSRVGMMLAKNGVPNPKKILALTFSVNAALKIKRDLSSNLPILMNKEDNPCSLDNKIFITNYHGLCKAILRKYGYVLTDFLRKDINTFDVVDENTLRRNPAYNRFLPVEEMGIFEDVCCEIKNGNIPNSEQINIYLSTLQRKLLPQNVATFNSIILFAIKLLRENIGVRSFYQQYFPMIIVDEFQDTNGISWELLKMLVSQKTSLLFLGDPLQRIYGFIGAFPNIMNVAERELGMKKMELNKNHRFSSNQDMLLFNDIIRFHYAKNFSAMYLGLKSNVPYIYSDTLDGKVNGVVELVEKLIQKEMPKIVLLFRGRNEYLTDAFERALMQKNIPYFYGLITDDEKEYISFHNKALNLFKEKFNEKGIVTKRSFDAYIETLKDVLGNDLLNKKIQSCFLLLIAFRQKIFSDYSDLSSEKKCQFVKDVLERRQLKQSMEYIGSNVVLTTVHSAKGLEWDYVFICDLEKTCFPSFFTCRDYCPNYGSGGHPVCCLPYDKSTMNINKMLEELSVFYVAITRARKQVYLSFSTKKVDNNGNIRDAQISCFPYLEGIELVNACS
ncbi:MAG: ATP-dependent helicase [Fibrobacter sp.]|nr:ATP-dependent helicase [Fibrobacter sp.]